MLNKAILMGRLTRDPVLRRVNDTSVVNFTLAIDRKTKDRDGKKITDFIDIVTWGKLADWCTNWLEKGVLVIVVGQIQVRRWDDKYGNRRVSVEVRADEVKFGETKKSRALAAADTSEGSPPEPEDFQELSDEDAGDTPF